MTKRPTDLDPGALEALFETILAHLVEVQQIEDPDEQYRSLVKVQRWWRNRVRELKYPDDD